MQRLIRILALTVALILGGTVAAAEPIVIAHRGSTTPIATESTLEAYKAAMPYANMGEADIHWSKDSSDPDTVGTIVVTHDPNLERTTNCTGNVRDRLWSYLSQCRTNSGHRLLRLVDLITYMKSINKPLMIDLKVSNITDAQARQLWSYIRTLSPYSTVCAASWAISSLRKVRKLDVANTSYGLRYGWVINWQAPPTVAQVKAEGTKWVIARFELGTSWVRLYQEANILVALYTLKSEAQYRVAYDKRPNGLIVDDAKRYNTWRKGVS